MIPRTHRQLIVDKALATTEQDNESFLKKFEERVQQCVSPWNSKVLYIKL